MGHFRGTWGRGILITFLRVSGLGERDEFWEDRIGMGVVNRRFYSRLTRFFKYFY